MGVECAFSFTDLYIAAFGHKPSEAEMADFGRASQDERNRLVRIWAEKAGWETKDKLGSDGRMYTAFCPSFSMIIEAPPCDI